MEDNRCSYEAFMHGSTLTTMNVLITFSALICVSNFLLYFQSMPKNFSFKISHEASINSFLKHT